MKTNPLSQLGKHCSVDTQKQVQAVVRRGILAHLEKEEHNRDNLLGIKSALRAATTSIEKGIIHPEIIEKIEERLVTNTDLHQSCRFEYINFLKNLHSRGSYNNWKPQTLEIITGKKSNHLGANTIVSTPLIHPKTIMQAALINESKKVKHIDFVEVFELDKVLVDIANLNQANHAIIELTKKGGELDSCYRTMRSAAKSDSIIFHQGLPINQWDKSQITKWASSIKKAPEVANDLRMLPEMIAVIDRAISLHNKHTPRAVQLASIMIMELRRDQGSLLQISTGEGKSCTTAMMATLNALKSKNVDIITSSSVLAKRDAGEWSSFYDIFGLSNAHNITTGQVTGLKDCYTKNIVYGDALNFQADTLREEYKLLGTKGGRNFASSIAIIDEVDSMLIDDSGRIAKLATPSPSMEYLAPIFVTSYHYLKQMVNYFKEEEAEGGASLDSHLPWMQENLTGYIEKLVGIGAVLDDTEQILVPSHLQSFVEKQAPVWAKSVITALSMSEKRDYLIIEQDGKKVIAPIDYASTGVVQERTSWMNGLHQYMQIKHNLAMTSESFTSSFISNMAYFKRYQGQIFGMSGTLGSTHEQELLKQVYGVDLAFIPTFKPKKFTEIPAIVAESTKEWYKALLDTAISIGQAKRATLILAETIEDVENIQQSLIDGGIDKDFIHTYTTSSESENRQVIETTTRIGHVIVATNLAGRGTDIKVTPAVENSGGLHVCVSFLPSNLRVEEQAFGRTARQGLSGSAGLVLNGPYESLKLHNTTSDQEDINIQDIEILRLRRDIAEHLRLQDIKERLIPKIEIEDEVFSRFSLLSHELKAIDDNTYKLRQLEEHWGLWFKDISHQLDEAAKGEINGSEILQAFDNFAQDMRVRYGSNSIMANPSYLTLEGVNEFGKGNSYDKSVELLTNASSIAGEYGFAANYNLAYSYFRKNGENLKNNHLGYIENGIQHLNSSLMQLESVVIPQLHMMQILVGNGENHSELSMQIATKLSIHQMQSNYIRNALELIEKGMAQDKVIVVKDSDSKPIFEIVGQSPTSASSEVLELARFGSTQFFTLDAKSPPKDTLSGIGVGILGASQFIVGALVTVCSAGAATPLGASMMISGAQDLYHGVRAAMGKETINWSEYWVNKGISYAISIISMGWDNFKAGLSAIKEQAGRLAEAGKNFFTNTATNVMGKQAATQITTEGLKEGAQTTFTSIAKDFIAKEGMSRVVMEVGKSIITQNITNIVAKEIANSLDGTKEDIQQDAYQRIMETLSSEPTSIHLNRLIAMDKMVGSNSHVQAVKVAATKALNPKIDRITQLARVLSTAAMSGMAARSGNVTANIGMKVATIGAGILEASNEIKQLIGDFCQELQERIAEIDQRATSVMPKVMSAYLQKFVRQKEDIDTIIEILKYNKIFNEQTMEFNSDLIKPSVNFEAGITFKDPLPEPPIANPQIIGGIVINKPKPQEVRAFQLKELKKNSGDKGRNIEEIDFGPFRYHREKIIELVRHLSSTKATHYQEERQALAKELAGSVSSRTMGIIRHSIISPLTAPVISLGVDKMAQAFMDLPFMRPKVSFIDSETTGVSAGDDGKSTTLFGKLKERLEERKNEQEPEITDSELEEMPQLANSDLDLLNIPLPEGFNISSEVSEMINKANADKIQPIFSISINKPLAQSSMFSSGYSELFGMPTAYGNTGHAVVAGSQMFADGGLNLALGYGARGALSLGGTVLSSVSAPLLLSSTVLAGGAVGVYQGAQFENKHPWISQDFDDILFNPLVPQSTKDEMWQQMRNDPLIRGRQSSILTQVNVNALPQLNPFAPHNSNAFSSIMLDPRFNRPSILSTPIHNEPRSILFTPDDRSTLARFGELPGFTPNMHKTWKEYFPDQRQVIADFDMNILYKKIDLDYGKLSKEHFDNDVRYIHAKKYEGAKIADLDSAVVERMAKLIITDGNGVIRGVHNTQDHHIIHQATDGAKELFNELGLDIHAPENRITLPSDTGLTEHEITKMTQHIGKHDEEAQRKIQVEVDAIKKDLRTEEISQEQAKERLLDFIQKQRKELESGQEFLNSVGKK